MFAGRGSAFVVTTTASRRGLICLTDVTCSPATSWNATGTAVRLGVAANAGAAANAAQALTAAIRRFIAILQRSPQASSSPAPSTRAVEPAGDQPVSDGRGRRQQRATSKQVVAAEPSDVFELVVAGAELAADRTRFEAEHQRGGERPRLAAPVDDLVDDDAGLLPDLACHCLLQRLPRLDEPGERRVAVGRPGRLTSEQAAVATIVDEHDHRWVGAREVL